MKTIGFVISHKENERRRALIPSDIIHIKNKSSVFVESGYGKVLGFCDQDYIDMGVNVADRAKTLNQDIICDPKVGDAEYLTMLHKDQTIFGWIHAVQNKDITDKIVDNQLTAIAWEDMFYKGQHIFWRNNEIAGEAAVMHAYSLMGIFPYETKVALLGNGNVARGAYRILISLGATVDQYNRRTERLLSERIGNYDVVVNAILWDTKRTDHIIYKKDLKRMRRNAFIIDISCDRNGGVETSIPTTIDDPIYYIDGIAHYVVDHTPSIFYKTISSNLSSICSKYVDSLIEGHLEGELEESLIIKGGVIIDQRIIDFQKR
jgi:N5-(carboxyethyl)ornithine synthase